MDGEDISAVVEALQKLAAEDPRQLFELSEQLDKAIDEAHRHEGALMREGGEGSPRDTLVQKLAGWALRELKVKQGWTYDRIGSKFGVSRERVRKLFEKLCPFDYQAMRRSG